MVTVGTNVQDEMKRNVSSFALKSTVVATTIRVHRFGGADVDRAQPYDLSISLHVSTRCVTLNSNVCMSMVSSDCIWILLIINSTATIVSNVHLLNLFAPDWFVHHSSTSACHQVQMRMVRISGYYLYISKERRRARGETTHCSHWWPRPDVS